MSRTERMVSWWTWRYTAGLPREVIEVRRAEIVSDMAEHRKVRTGEGWPAERVARERLGRLVRGVPADLAWRHDVLAPLGRSTGPVRALVAAVTTVTSLMLAAFQGAFAAYLLGAVTLADQPLLRGFGGYAEEVDKPVAGTVAAAVIAMLALVLVIGTITRPVAPFLANVVTIAAATPAMLFFWLGVTPIAVVAVIGAAADLALRAPELARPS